MGAGSKLVKAIHRETNWVDIKTEECYKLFLEGLASICKRDQEAVPVRFEFRLPDEGPPPSGWRQERRHNGTEPPPASVSDEESDEYGDNDSSTARFIKFWKANKCPRRLLNLGTQASLCSLVLVGLCLAMI